MRLIKDELSINASGERELVKGIEPDPSRKEERPMRSPTIHSSASNIVVAQQGELPEHRFRQAIPTTDRDNQRGSGFVKAKKQRSQEPGTFRNHLNITIMRLCFFT